MLKLKQYSLPVAALLGLASVIQAQEIQTAQPDAAQMEAMMAEMLKHAAPGEHHQHIAPLAGDWDFTMKFHMAPDAPWEENTGHATHQWVLGGRFLQSTTHSPPSASIPMEFEGLGLLGYDNFAEEYVQLWMDNFMTGVVILKGSCAKNGKQITITGELTKPMAGVEPIPVRWVYQIESDDRFTFEMWEPDQNGEEYLHGQITYGRVK